MSKLTELLEGVQVQWKALGEISDIYGGLTGKGKADFVSGNSSYISYKNIYDNIEVNLSKLESVKIADSENQNEVKYGDVLFTGSSETADEAGISSAVTTKFLGSVYLNSFSFGLRFNDDIEIIPEFSKYLFRSHFMRLEISKTASGVTRYNISKARFKRILIPIPPISAQKEIVRILDTFTKRTDTLINELTIELAARKKQYNYYREMLMSFKEGEIEWKELGKLTNVLRGKRLIREQLSNINKFPVFHGGLEPLGYYEQKNRPADSVMIINVGASAGTVGYSDVDFWSSDGCYSIEQSDKLNNKFLYYYLIGQQHFLVSRVRKAGIPTLDAPVIEKLQIPIPALIEQKRIVAILDKLNSLTTSISEALPKEIALRKKQYEYYRDLLLTFPNDNLKA